MQIQRADLSARTTRAHAVTTDGLTNGISARAFRLRKAEVIVRGEVEALTTATGEGEGLVVVIRDALEDLDGATRDAGDGAEKDVRDAGFEATNVKVIKVAVEGGVALMCIWRTGER